MAGKSAQYLTKDPDAVLDYATDWSDWLSDAEAIASSQWLLSGGDTGDGAPETVLTIDSDENSDTAATVWLSLGTLGQKYTVVNRITTDQGRTEDRSKFVSITQH